MAGVEEATIMSHYGYVSAQLLSGDLFPAGATTDSVGAGA